MTNCTMTDSKFRPNSLATVGERKNSKAFACIHREAFKSFIDARVHSVFTFYVNHVVRLLTLKLKLAITKM